jgi:NitT/TauT family transport system substrate-binding protein
MKRTSTGLLLVLVVLLTFTSACSGIAGGTAPIRVGMLPILDGMPMYVAQAEGYFAEENVTVEFIPVASAAERDQLMQAGQIDAMINDLVSTMLYNRDRTEIVIVRFARTATPSYPQFRVLAAADSGILSPDDLRGVQVAVSEGTVIAYTTDRLLQGAGLTNVEIETLAVPNIVERMTLLGSGQVQAANLPDPLASLAILNGASVVIDDTADPDIGSSVISFRAEYLRSNPDSVRGFLAAVERAVADINADKDRWIDLLEDEGLVPPPLLGVYPIPDFPFASVPSQAQFEDVLMWTLDEGMVESEVGYDSSISSSYLP